MAHFFPEPWLIFTRRGGSYSPEQWLKALHIIQRYTCKAINNGKGVKKQVKRIKI